MQTQEVAIKSLSLIHILIKDPGQYYEAYYSQLYNYSRYSQGLNAVDANSWANQKMISDLKYNVYTVPDGQMLIGTDGQLNPNATLGRKYNYQGTDYYLRPDDWKDLAYKSALRQEYLSLIHILFLLLSNGINVRRQTC